MAAMFRFENGQEFRLKRLLAAVILSALVVCPAWPQQAPVWHLQAPGFETADVSLNMFSLGLGKIALVRINPAQWHFSVKLDAAGAHDLRRWMGETKAALVVNGSFYGQDSQPVTPVLSGGKLTAPKRYISRSAAFVAAAGRAAVVSLKGLAWQKAFAGQSDALVSFPALIVNGKEAKIGGRGHFANRSFIAQDKAGRIVIGTTSLAPVALQDFAKILAGLKLELVTALNLDGGPLACQSVKIGALKRETCDSELLPVDFSGNNYVQKLPIVIAVTPNSDDKSAR